MKVKLVQIIAKSNDKDILGRWRKLGFLSGLKEGGVIERRCAVSYEKLANYLLDDNNPYVGKYLEVWLFAFLRRLLTTKHRVNRIVEPQEILDALNSLTMAEVFQCLQENKYKIKRPLLRLVEYKKLGEKPVLDVLKSINKDGDYKLYDCVTESDVEADLCAYVAAAVKEKLNKKSAK